MKDGNVSVTSIRGTDLSVLSQGSLCCKRAPVSPNLSALRRKEKTEATDCLKHS